MAGSDRLLPRPDELPPGRPAAEGQRAAGSWRAPALLLAAVLACLGTLFAVKATGPGLPPLTRLHGLRQGAAQHVYIVRHGDKYSSYPPCPQPQGAPCFDEASMGDNPPLTACGIRQAEYSAAWLHREAAKVGGIQHIVVSPFVRALQTALPLARLTGLLLKVDHGLSEGLDSDGPFREANVALPEPTVAQLREIHAIWDTSYGGPPIFTPESNEMYVERVAKASAQLAARLPPSAGNLAIHAHASSSFSIAYGLCYGRTGNDQTLQDFLERQDAIGPGGIIHLALDAASGKCLGIDQTWNVAEVVGCGQTPPYKCDFADFPAFYWAHSAGRGPGRC